VSSRFSCSNVSLTGNSRLDAGRTGEDTLGSVRLRRYRTQRCPTISARAASAKPVKASASLHIDREKLMTGPDGAFVLLTERSTMPIAAMRSHAGIVKTRCYAFDLPECADGYLIGRLARVAETQMSDDSTLN
jgi:hypothetical protein